MKLIDDTLKKSNGKWDKQALTMFISFSISIVLGVSNTIVSYMTELTSNPTADNVFNSFMFLTAALSGTNIVNKYVDVVKARSETTSNNNNPYNEQNLNQISNTDPSFRV